MFDIVQDFFSITGITAVPETFGELIPWITTVAISVVIFGLALRFTLALIEAFLNVVRR